MCHGFDRVGARLCMRGRWVGGDRSSSSMFHLFIQLCAVVVVALREGLETGGHCSLTLLLHSTVTLMLVDFMSSFVKEWCLGRTVDHSVSSVPDLGARLKSSGSERGCHALMWGSARGAL